jgi:hypothetical protein
LQILFYFKGTTETTTTSAPTTTVGCIVTIEITDSPLLVKENEGSVKIKIFRPSINPCNLNRGLKVDYHTEPFSATTSNFVSKFVKP